MLCLMSETQARGNDLIYYNPHAYKLQIGEMGPRFVKWHLLVDNAKSIYFIIFYSSILVNNRFTFILPDEIGAMLT